MWRFDSKLAPVLVLGCGCAGTVERDTGNPDSDGNAVEACPEKSDEEKNDLYQHQIQAENSEDGVSFEPSNRVLLEHASVPDAIRFPDGRVWVYYINGEPGQHAIFVAERNADSTLTPFDCVRIDGVVNTNAVDPDVLLLKDGRVRLHFYQGDFGTGGPSGDGPHPFFSATSDDGLLFTVDHQVFELNDQGTDPTVVPLDDGTWLMAIATDEGARILTSEDGESYSLNAVQFEKGIPELAIADDGSVRLYLSSEDEGIQLHQSLDGGETWGTLGPIGLGGHDPSVLREADGSWTLFRKTFASSGGDQ